MLDFRTFGDPTNPALTLLHAGGLTYREWTPFVEAWSQSYFVITPTALGHGASPRVDILRFDDLARAVRDLHDHLGVSQSHLLGSSMGGVTSLAYTLLYPERVRTLTLYRASFRADPKMEQALEAMTDPETWRRWGLETLMRTQHEPQGGPEAWIEVTRRVIEMVQREKRSGQVATEDLARIDSPTLIIAGDRDPLVPLADVLHMYQTMKDARLWIVPHATHILQVETFRRAAFETEVLQFLEDSDQS